MGVPLLETKLHLPRRRSTTVSRPRLRARVRPGDLPSLTLVSAPAGFGKTTAAVECFADHGRVAWVSLDGRDGDPGTFWGYVTEALDRVEPGVGRGATAQLEQPGAPIDAVVATLINDVDAIGEAIVLVLDDYHLVESVDVHRSLELLLEHLPPQLRLVLLTRADPPLPLAALRADGDLLEVRAADLRFTTDEATTYLNEAMGLALAPDQVERLEERTEGWVAALQLAALSLQGRTDAGAFVASFSGDDRFVLDYLVGEVLERQPEEVRTFLVETSVLSRLSGDLCDDVTDRHDSRAVLEQLERSNLFVVPLDDRRTWYRYHHLFADVLRARLLQDRSGRAGELHRRASDWWAEHGEPAEAVAHAMAGEDPERAARVIELAATTMGRRRQDAARRAAIEALPTRLFADRPVLAVALVGARMVTGDTTGVADLLDLAEARMRDAEPPVVFDHAELARLPSQIAIYRAALDLLAEDVGGAIDHASTALELASEDDHFGRGSASAIAGLAIWRTGDLVGAEARYRRAIDGLAAAGFTADVLGCTVTLGDLQIAQGRLRDATRSYEDGLRVVADHPGIRGAVDMHVGLAEALLERGQVDEADRHLQAARELGGDAGLPQSTYRWLLTAARLQRVRGDLAGTLALLDQAAPVYDTDFSPAARPIPAWQARVHVAQGDLGRAQAWARERGLGADDEVGYLTEFEHHTLARILLAGDAHDDAVRLLERLLADAELGGRATSAIEALVMLARAHRARGDAAAAATAMEQALVRAEPEGHVLPFLHGSTDLVRSVGRSGAAGRLASAVLEVHARLSSPAPRAGRSPLVDELSERELEVLQGLKGDLSGPDLARELHVSLNTFRTHTKHIFTKLGVSNRREAVRRAAELGL